MSAAGSTAKIRTFADIPDVISMEIPPVEYLVPALGIARNTITLWTGADGDGKTYVAQAMACAVSRGEAFLGVMCQRTPVLYVDLENPAYVVQERLQSLVGEGPVDNLRVWGMWNEQPPPQFGSELLYSIVRETKPLLIFDPFRYFHNCEENDSTAMAGVMQYLRQLASVGAAVVVLHHPAKTEGSTGRGSSAIRGACDLAFLHSLDKESSTITLKVDKNRNGECRSITIRAEFEAGRFEVTESPWIVRHNQELEKLKQIISASPGLSQNAIIKAHGGMKARVSKLLNEGDGTTWESRQGPNRSRLYYPISWWFSNDRTTDRTTEPLEEQALSGSGGSPLKGENHRTTTPQHPCSGGSRGDSSNGSGVVL